MTGPIGITLPVQLLVIGPDPNDDEAHERHNAGRWYTALALIVHATCLRSATDEELDKIAGEVELTEERATSAG